MPSRDDILKNYGLPPDVPFQLEPSYSADGTSVWRVHFSWEGGHGLHMGISGARRLADELRRVDSELATQIDIVVAEILKMPNHPARS